MIIDKKAFIGLSLFMVVVLLAVSSTHAFAGRYDTLWHTGEAIIRSLDEQANVVRRADEAAAAIKKTEDAAAIENSNRIAREASERAAKNEADRLANITLKRKQDIEERVARDKLDSIPKPQPVRVSTIEPQKQQTSVVQDLKRQQPSPQSQAGAELGAAIQKAEKTEAANIAHIRRAEDNKRFAEINRQNDEFIQNKKADNDAFFERKQREQKQWEEAQTRKSPDQISIDRKGNAIPHQKDQYLTGSPDGKWIQVRNADGSPTGTRIDGGHSPKTHNDPRALSPHAHVPGKTTKDGKPWLPVRQ
ncbi:MAG: hypothetical protein KAJ86_07495 [Alphaproteobacteria bacterium]|nr:hypothetical protein [Alphaproteobacteria bacterium]